MTEEMVTKSILKWLIQLHWKIVCYDFPQSGTGYFLHPNNSKSEKNKGTINPDIVAVKGNTCIFFENKDRFYYLDYEKQNSLINGDNYSIAINNLLSNYSVNEIYYGIGLPTIKHSNKSKQAEYLVDFIIGVEENSDISVLFNPKLIEFYSLK
nr:hypothetical protein [uncultured Faecalibacillus sp.]